MKGITTGKPVPFRIVIQNTSGVSLKAVKIYLEPGEVLLSAQPTYRLIASKQPGAKTGFWVINILKSGAKATIHLRAQFPFKNGGTTGQGIQLSAVAPNVASTWKLYYLTYATG